MSDPIGYDFGGSDFPDEVKFPPDTALRGGAAMLKCCIDSKPVPEDRMKRRGSAQFTCSEECYAQLRKLGRKPKNGKRCSEAEFPLVMRIRRAVRRGAKEITLQL